MAVIEDADARPRELLLQIRLAAINHDQLWFQRQYQLDVGIEKRANARQPFHFRRIRVVAADAHHTRPCADREEHLGGGWDQGDDPVDLVIWWSGDLVIGRHSRRG